MKREMRAFVNRYGILAASLSMFALAQVILVYRVRDMGVVGVVMAGLLIVMAALLAWVFVAGLFRREL